MPCKWIPLEQPQHVRRSFEQAHAECLEPRLVVESTERGKPHLPVESRLVRRHPRRRPPKIPGLADFAGPNPYDTFRRCRDRYLLATDHEGALQTMIKSRLGEMTLDTYIGKMCIDTLVHTWDVAHGSGVDDSLDPDAVHTIWSQVSGAASEGTDLVRGPGFFDPELPPTGADESDLLLAFTGRAR